MGKAMNAPTADGRRTEADGLRFPGAEILLRECEINPDGFHHFALQRTLEFHLDRVRCVGFEGKARVLDAGCGYGQWSVAMAKLNGHVVGLDRKPLFLNASRKLCEVNGVRNVEFVQGDIHALPFPSAAEDPAGGFDGIWCWGVLMFTDRSRVLREFRRVLRPGGHVLIGGTNARGRWLKKFLESFNPLDRRLFLDRKRMRSCASAFFGGGEVGATPNWTSRASIREIAPRFGFRVVESGFDGEIGAARSVERHPPLTARRFLGFENNIEFLLEAVEPGSASGA